MPQPNMAGHVVAVWDGQVLHIYDDPAVLTNGEKCHPKAVCTLV